MPGGNPCTAQALSERPDRDEQVGLGIDSKLAELSLDVGRRARPRARLREKTPREASGRAPARQRAVPVAPVTGTAEEELHRASPALPSKKLHASAGQSVS
jgi:hypothetical protein